MNHPLTRTLLLLVAGLTLLAVTTAQAAPSVSCELEPLELPLFGGTPVAALDDHATPESTGAVADEEIEATLEQYVACVNTGDPTLVWAMFSPRWFSTQFADPSLHYLPAFEQMLDGPVTPAEPPLKLEGIEDIAALPDGRIDVTATFSSGEDVWTDSLILVKIDGTWMIDDVRLNAPAT